MPFTSFLTKGCALVLFYYVSSVTAQNCVLSVPTNPLSAKGLATPYTVTGCNQIDFGNQGSFVEAAIFDPATNQISVYHPLVVNQGAVAGTDFIPPVPAQVPQGATVGIWFGTNAASLTLAGDTRNCVNGLGGSVFGQFAHCNGDVFFQTTQAAVASGKLNIPSPGTGTGGQCPTTRDFRVVDMDQSDNVVTTYLLIGGKKLAQNTPENSKAHPNAEELTNGSDNALINEFIAPALGCQPFQVSSATAPSGKTPSLATNELQANFFPPASGPALVPLNDDFAVINNNGQITQSLAKTNLYRAGVGQPLAQDAANASGTTYCQQFAASGLFIHQFQGLLGGQPSPAPNVGSNLFTFLAQRFQASFGPVPALGCTTLLGVQNPVNLSISTQGITTGAFFNDQLLKDILSGKIQPSGAAKAATQAATSATPSQSAQVLGHGTKQHKHKGHNNVVPNQAGGTAPSVTPNPQAANQTASTAASSAASAASAASSISTTASSQAAKLSSQAAASSSAPSATVSSAAVRVTSKATSSQASAVVANTSAATASASAGSSKAGSLSSAAAGVSSQAAGSQATAASTGTGGHVASSTPATSASVPVLAQGATCTSAVTATVTVHAGAQTVTVTQGAATMTVAQGAQTVTVTQGAKTVTVIQEANTVTVDHAAQTVTVTQRGPTVTATVTAAAGGTVGGTGQNGSPGAVNSHIAVVGAGQNGSSAVANTHSAALSVSTTPSAKALEQSTISSATPTHIPCNGGAVGNATVSHSHYGRARRHPRAFHHA